MRKSQVIIDASFLLKLFFPEEKSEKAESLWRKWIEESVEIAGPFLLISEVSSVMRNKVYRKIIGKKEGDRMMRILKEMDILLIEEKEILEIAWEIAEQINYPTLYDCFYIAVAKFLKAPLWTADRELFIKGKEFADIHLL